MVLKKATVAIAIRGRHARQFTVLLFLAANGCRDRLPPFASLPQPDSGSAAQTAAGLTDPSLGLDERFLRIAEQLPGFAGFHYNRENTAVVVLLTDLAQSDRARIVLPPVLGLFNLGGSRNASNLPMVFRQVEFSWDQLYHWEYALRPILRAGGLRSRDLDEMANRIVIGMADAASRDRVLTAARQIGIPAAALAVRLEEGAIGHRMPSAPAPLSHAGYAIEFFEGQP